jgi:glycosyltransferase involved in cell wall biosynthesis
MNHEHHEFTISDTNDSHSPQGRPIIAVVCAGCGDTGSVANVAMKQSIGLSKDFSVYLISDTHSQDYLGEVQKIKLPIRHFTWLRRYGHVARELAFVFSARRALNKLHHDRGLHLALFHSHTTTALAGRKLHRNFSLPIGLVSHGDIFDRPKGAYDPRLTWLYRTTTPPAYREANLVVALSPCMAEAAIRYGADPSSIELIPNGFDLSEIGVRNNALPPSELPPEAPLKLLYVGRLSIEKGVDILLKSCYFLHKWGTPFLLHIVGSGPLHNDLKSMVNNIGIGDKVIFVGSQKRSLLGAFYDNCHVVCVPSRSDSLPTVVLEGLASCRAIVGSNIGGITFMIKNEISGLLVAPDAPEDLAKALDRLAHDPQLIVGLGKNGHAEARKRFTWAANISALSAAIASRVKTLN